jgi:GntR family transcriptional regulator
VSAQAKYQEIADRLRDQIRSGVLAPDERLPSEPDLIRGYDASRNTVRLALALLTNQGLVVTRQGLGTFVLGPTRPFTALLSRSKGQPSGNYASQALPVVSPDTSKPETVRTVVETVSASRSQAEKLLIEQGDEVIVRRTMQNIDDVPWLLINSYFPVEVAGGTPLAQAGQIAQGSMRMLAELGFEQVGFIDEIGSRMPNSRELDFFRLPVGVPVIVVNRTAYSSERPIRLTRYIYRGDRVRLAHVEGTIPAKFRQS